MQDTKRENNKIVFMGTPTFAAEILRELIKEFNVEAVFTQTDKPSGRGKKLTFSKVKEVALEENIELLQPLKLRNDEATLTRLKDINPDLIVVVAYGQILSKEVLELPRLGCINLHASILPKYRGASPIQSVILNGESKTGNTVMQMDEGLDTGDIISQSEIEIGKDTTYGELHDMLMDDGKLLLIKTIKELFENNVQKIKQDDSLASYSGKIEKKDEILDFNKNAIELHNQVRALNPHPLAYTYLNGSVLKIVSTEVVPNGNNSPYGTVFEIGKDYFLVSTKDSSLKVKSVQPQGKKVMTSKDFLNGKKLKVNDVLGQ